METARNWEGECKVRGKEKGMPLPSLFKKAEPLVSAVPGAPDAPGCGGAGAPPPDSPNGGRGPPDSPGGGGPALPPAWSIPFYLQAQEQNAWCWAAVAASVAQFYNTATPWA